jgi:thiol-disulfide isomerase/thioredoxin
MSIPALLVYQNGDVVRRIVGAMPRATLINELKEFIG